MGTSLGFDKLTTSFDNYGGQCNKQGENTRFVSGVFLYNQLLNNNNSH